MTQAPVSRRTRRRRTIRRVYHQEDDGHRSRPRAGSQPSGDLGSVLQLITAIGSPIALGTALLFYFGWRRSAAEAEALGFDVSVLGMSPQDFMLRSVPVFFFPVALLLLASLGALWTPCQTVAPPGTEPGSRPCPPHRTDAAVVVVDAVSP